ncbi:uncharacterized protein LOC106673101 [Cimex lectularius]|uniref:DUF4789 domain-containing protein n=1 Tax=Cimex lectularius TaxID=79782 RepID=A0A8I6SB74_CIMLE|nr:uncharacterized protein LOC106673101 [Cimex lectularius]
MDYFYVFNFLFLLSAATVSSTVLVPPWGDPTQNPCALKPNGWQLLYWPEDEKCYKIFQKGYPCSETMELVPGKGGKAECQCPPGTAQSPRDAICHKIFTKGPCQDNEYFAPVTTTSRSIQRHRWGACFQIENCEAGTVYWPKDGKCYPEFTKGPCSDGLLLFSKENLGQCLCDNSTMLHYFWNQSSTCYEHFIQGPCKKGQIFLPGGTCGCEKTLKEYYPENGLCYPIGSNGPCKQGHHFVLGRSKSDPKTLYGRCACKEGHILWEEDGNCYKPFTRGPCAPGKMLEISYEGKVAMKCVQLPCSAGNLYFQGNKGCHKVGSQGPCPPGQVVLYQDSSAEPLDNISYLGVCGCQSRKLDTSSFYPTYRAEEFSENGKCAESKTLTGLSSNEYSELRTTEDNCGSSHLLILWHDQSCQQLYTQGPCNEGEWVVPDRGKGQRKGRGWKMGKCECRPTYTLVTSKAGKSTCQPPSVELAKFLSLRFKKSQEITK